MAMLVVPSAIWHSVRAATPSTKVSAHQFPPQRNKLHKNRWRMASAKDAHDWRTGSRELRVEIQELQVALADAWMQDEMQILQLEKTVSELADLLHARFPTEFGRDEGHVEQARSESALQVPNLTIGRSEYDTSEVVKLGIEGAGGHEDNAITVSESQSEELRPEQEGLSTLRRLKHLNVHDYVHGALRASHMRSWLRDRGIAE